MYLSTWSCQHTCLIYFVCIYWQPEPPNDDLKETINSSHFSVKNEGCVIKNSHSFFSQYFRQGRPLNQVTLMVILTEKSKIKSIARRVRSSHILGVWIPDYGHSYDEARSISNLPTLFERRTKLCQSYFRKMHNADHKLNKLLPNQRNISYDLRTYNTLPVPLARTDRFRRSLIPWGLANWQHNVL